MTRFKAVIKKILSSLPILLLLVAMIGLILGIFAGKIDYQKQENLKQPEKTKSYTLSSHFKMKQLGQNAFLVSDLENSLLTNQYILTQEIAYKKPLNDYLVNPQFDKSDRNRVHIFLLNQPDKPYREYDLLKIAQEYAPQAVPNSLDNHLYLNPLDQQLYFAFDVYWPDSGKAKLLSIYVNIENGRFYQADDYFQAIEKTIEKWTYEGGDFQNKLSKYGLTMITSPNNYVAIQSASADINLKDLKISQTYPQLEKELKDGKSFVLVGDQAYPDMIKLLAKEGEVDLYTGLKLSAQYSKDYQEHLLGSYQDYLHWYRAD